MNFVFFDSHIFVLVSSCELQFLNPPKGGECVVASEDSDSELDEGCDVLAFGKALVVCRFGFHFSFLGNIVGGLNSHIFVVAGLSIAVNEMISLRKYSVSPRVLLLWFLLTFRILHYKMSFLVNFYFSSFIYFCNFYSSFPNNKNKTTKQLGQKI